MQNWHISAWPPDCTYQCNVRVNNILASLNNDHVTCTHLVRLINELAKI